MQEPYQNGDMSFKNRILSTKIKTLSGLQRGVQTCQQSCMDVIQPQLDAIRSGLQKQPSEAEQKVMQTNVEQCASKCITDHGIGKLTDVESRLMGYIKGFRLN